MRSEVSQRLIRKGALVEETYAAFRDWRLDDDVDANLNRLANNWSGTSAWKNEIRLTLRRRFGSKRPAVLLITLAKSRLPFDEWRSCLLLWVSIREQLYRDFVTEWLYRQYVDGVYQITAEDVKPFVRGVWKTCNTKTVVLSDYGTSRTARDLVRMAKDFGLLTGDGSQKRFASFHLSDRCFLLWAQIIAEQEGATARVPGSQLWRFALMQPADVEQEILRLHQFRKLDYQVAGSLVQLSLPCETSIEYAERMVA